MIATEERLNTFLAAWKIQQMMYQPGLFRSIQQVAAGEAQYKARLLENLVLRSDLATKKSEECLNCEPRVGLCSSTLGVIFTYQGLVVIFHGGVPIWMETPWGEWWCWEVSGPGAGFPEKHTRGHEEKLFLSKVRIDENRSSVKPGYHSHYFIKSVGDIALPKVEMRLKGAYPETDVRACAAEWIRLCEAMEPQRYPHWRHYIDADLPIPQDHPSIELARKDLEFYRQPNVSGPDTHYVRKYGAVLFK